jgi:hypothetical protein
MEAQNHTSEKNTVLITQSSKKIEEILCKSIFNDFTTQVAKEKGAIIETCKAHDTIVLSSNRLDICTLVYKHYLQGECNLHLLQPIDINENGLDNESIFRFTLFNLELFRKKSFRAKATFIAKSTIGEIKKDKYREIFDVDSMDKAPLLYINLYRVIAFENQTALTRIFDLLKEFNKNTQSSYLDSFLPFIIYADAANSFCNSLITYYRQIDYTENDNKSFVFSFLNKIYQRMDGPTIQKIKHNFDPIICYCVCEDESGENVEMLDSYMESLPPLTKNLNVMGILTLAKIFRNEKYHDAFSSKMSEPGNKIEHSYHDILLKVEKLLKNEDTTSIPGLELKRGVDQYSGFLKDNNIPEETSPMFDLLLKQS